MEAESRQTVFWSSCALGMLLLSGRRVFVLAAAATAGVLFLTNPGSRAAKKDLREAGFSTLLDARTTLLSRETSSRLAEGRLGAALRAAFVDGGVRLALGRRCLLDMHVLSFAWIDSASEVDQSLVAVGALGEWRVVIWPALRGFVAAAAGLPAAAQKQE